MPSSTLLVSESGIKTQSDVHQLRGWGADAILVGELRDLETIRLAMTAAETGHLVFGTLHTSSAAKTIDRVINVFPAEQQESVRGVLAGVLRGVLAQQQRQRHRG